MTIELTSRAEAIIRQMIERGDYADPAVSLRKPSKSSKEQHKLARLKAAIAVGDEQYARGQVVAWTPDFLEWLICEADEEDRRGIPIKDEVKP